MLIRVTVAALLLVAAAGCQSVQLHSALNTPEGSASAGDVRADGSAGDVLSPLLLNAFPAPTVAPVVAVADPGSSADERPSVRTRIQDCVVQQRNEQWCWAACAEAIHRAERISDMSQEQIVRRFDQGWYSGSPGADCWQMCNALAPDVGERFERRLRNGSGLRLELDLSQVVGTAVTACSISSDDLISDLRSGRASVVGLRDGQGRGHACIAYAVDCTVVARPEAPSTGNSTLDELRAGLGKFGKQVQKTVSSLSGGRAGKDFNYRVVRVYLYDPWPASGGWRELTGEEFRSQVAFIFSSRTAREVLTQWVKALDAD